MATHIYTMTIYYEDTDMTGLVYHPNYLKYFERARSDYFGGAKLQQMQKEHGISVAVYRVECIFKRGLVLGDVLEIHSQPSIDGEYRIVFKQQVRRKADQTVCVEATVELVCIAQEKLAKLPAWVVERVQQDALA